MEVVCGIYKIENLINHKSDLPKKKELKKKYVVWILILIMLIHIKQITIFML